jgi:hypothetical protein
MARVDPFRQISKSTRSDSTQSQTMILHDSARLITMARRLSTLWIPLGFFTLVGCSKPVQVHLTDTEGRHFEASCKDSSCALIGAGEANPSASQPKGAKAAFVLHTASRLMAVCEVWVQGGAHGTHPADCRALTCQHDRDCPWTKGLSTGTCTHGLCIEPSSEITNEDAVLLCLAGTGAPRGTTQQIERHALGNACATPCVVPSVCRQP